MSNLHGAWKTIHLEPDVNYHSCTRTLSVNCQMQSLISDSCHLGNTISFVVRKKKPCTVVPVYRCTVVPLYRCSRSLSVNCQMQILISDSYYLGNTISFVVIIDQLYFSTNSFKSGKGLRFSFKIWFSLRFDVKKRTTKWLDSLDYFPEWHVSKLA